LPGIGMNVNAPRTAPFTADAPRAAVASPAALALLLLVWWTVKSVAPWRAARPCSGRSPRRRRERRRPRPPDAGVAPRRRWRGCGRPPPWLFTSRLSI
jgi:hypothetical protein